MEHSTYLVQGMTCDHCARAVTDELTKITGVTGVTVDVETGQVVVASIAPLGDVAVGEAVDEAGYDLVRS